MKGEDIDFPPPVGCGGWVWFKDKGEGVGWGPPLPFFFFHSLKMCIDFFAKHLQDVCAFERLFSLLLLLLLLLLLALVDELEEALTLAGTLAH